MTEKIIPDGYKLVAVKGLDELVYWLERCKDKGHIENCADLIEPFEAFEYRNVSEESVISAHEAKAAPAVPQGEPFGYFRAEPFGWTDCAATDEGAIALYERPAAPAAPAAPDVMSILRAIHRRPSDAGIWLDDITRILRDAPAPAVPQGEPEAYMVYGNYTRQPFRSIESAQAYMGGLLKSDPEGGYHIRPLFYATPAAPSQPAVPNVLKRGYGRLIQAAADLALQQFMPSDIVDDYPSKTISAAKVAKMMTQPRDRLRLLSIEVSEGAKQMIAATPAAPSQPAVPQGIPAHEVIDAIEAWKSAWAKVPPFGNKVNKATREAITISHNTLFQLLWSAQQAQRMPKACPTPTGCGPHGCHGACITVTTPAPSQPVTLTNGLIEKGAMTGMVDAQIDAIITALREKGKA